MHTAINNKLFRKLDPVGNAIREIESVKARVQSKKTIFVGLIIHQYANFRKIELCYNFFTKFRDLNKFGDLGLATVSLCVSFAEMKLGNKSHTGKEAM